MTASRQQIDGRVFQFAYDRTLDGQMKSVRYPSGRLVSYTLTAGGKQRDAVSSSGGRGTPQAITYGTGAQYAPNGALAVASIGPMTRTVTFDSGIRPTNVAIGSAAGNLFSLATAYAPNGNVTSQKMDTSASGTANSYIDCFTYDLANRLKATKEYLGGGCAGTQNYAQTFTYDGAGNRAATMSSAVVMPSLATPASITNFDAATNRIQSYCANANCSATTALPAGAYDGSGNLQNHPLMGQFQFDAENRMVSAVTSGNGASYTYDGSGRRVKRVVGGVATYFVYDADGNLAAEYGMGSTTITPTATSRYLGWDHLGSTRLTTDAAGSGIRRYDYLAFGEDVASDTQIRTGAMGFLGQESSVREQFTGKERDAETGLDYFGARYMSSASGRFTSPDPLMSSADLTLPQSWNRYGYVLNNPLRFVDPTGELWVASGDASKPYSWVDECQSNQVCHESVAAVVGGNLSVYGTRDAKDIKTYDANPSGLIDAVAVSQHDDAQFLSQQTPGREENYLAPAQAAALFNVSIAYSNAYPDDDKLVFTGGGSTALGVSAIPNRQSHRGGLNIDLSYMDSKGEAVHGSTAVGNADILRMGTIFSLFLAQNSGLGAPITGDPARFGIPAIAKKLTDGHQNHVHFQRTYPRKR